MSRRIQGIIMIAVAVVGFIVSVAILGLDTPIMMLVLWLVILGFGLSFFIDGKRKDSPSGQSSSRRDDEILSSSKLHEEMNEERRKEGQSSVQAINTIGGVSTNNLARKDKSWNSVPDFFAKMAKNSDKKHDQKQ